MSDDEVWQVYCRTISKVKLNKKSVIIQNASNNIRINNFMGPSVRNKPGMTDGSTNDAKAARDMVTERYQRDTALCFSDKYLGQSEYYSLGHGSTVGVDKATARAMDRGDYPIDRTIDLHGCTLDKAYDILVSEVRDAFLSGKRMLLIITGKGSRSDIKAYESTVSIKSMVGNWMNSPMIRPYILRFGVASKYHGGNGASYVLVRKNKLGV